MGTMGKYNVFNGCCRPHGRGCTIKNMGTMGEYIYDKIIIE